MSFPQVGFLRPELLVLLAGVVAIAALQARALVARRRALGAFAGVGAVLVSLSAPRAWLKAALAAIAAVALAVALAGPQIGMTERAVSQQGVELVIAVDVSQSMAVRDGEPDRLRAAKRVVETLARQLAGSRVALALFSGTGVVRYPATADVDILGQVLENSGRGFRLSPGTSLRAGIESSLAAFSPEVLGSGRRKALVVVSDGEDAHELPALDGFRERDVRVYTVGVGTAEGGQIPTYDSDGRQTGVLRGFEGQPVTSRLDEESLRTIAARGGGRYVHYTGSEADLRELSADLRSLDVSELSTELVPADRFQWFVALAVAALLLDGVLSDRRPMPLPRAGLAPRDRRAPAPRRFGERPA